MCDHHNYRVQKYLKGATSGTTVVDVAGNGYPDHPEGLTFDKNGYLYIAGHGAHRVMRFPPNSVSGQVVAGSSAGKAGATLDLLNEPLGVAVDDNLNVYVAERVGQRVMKWTPSATAGTIVIDPTTATSFYGLLLSPYAANQVYVSSESQNAVYLWNFNSTTPLITYQTVNSTKNLVTPRGIRYDHYGNLYVADRGNDRVVMYCANSTVGRVVVGGTGTTPALANVLDVALDSDLNIFVSDESLNELIRYDRL